MRGAADGGGFLGGDSAKAEVVELERKKRGIAGADQGFANDLLDRAGKRGDRDGIPDLDQKRFGPVSEPVELRIGVFNGDERVVSFDDGALPDRADAEREATAMLRVEGLEAFIVEGLRMVGKVRVGDAPGFFHIVEGEDLAGEIGFDDVLEQRQHGFFEHAAAGLKVRIDVARVRGILPPVGELVRVGVEDGVQSQRLHGTHLEDSRGRGDEKSARRGTPQKGKKVETSDTPGRTGLVLANGTHCQTRRSTVVQTGSLETKDEILVDNSETNVTR